MRRIPPVLFALFLLFGLVTSVVIAQRMAPGQGVLRFDGTVTFIHAASPTPPPQQVNSPTPNPDFDGDGTPNTIDQCPEQGGPLWNNGCPTDQTAPGNTDTIVLTAEVAPPAHVVALPVMPFTGDCVLATRSDQGVNIRIQPSTSAAIVGVLDPQTLYPVNGQHNDANSVWDRIAAGWVARRVVRLGGNCDTLPEVTLAEGPTYSLVNPPISCDVTELIDAIKNAPNGATIELAPGCTYTLTTAIAHVDYGNGHYGLPFITRRLTINGNGATIRRSSAGGTPDFAIFSMNSSADLTLTDLTLRNGVGWQDNSLGCAPCSGAAIFNLGGKLDLTNVTVQSNNGTGVGSFDSAAIMTVSDSHFDSNMPFLEDADHQAGCGAALENDGQLTISSSAFTNNSLPDTVSTKGSVLCNQFDGQADVMNSTFEHNHYGALGGTSVLLRYTAGAIYNEGHLTVSSTTFHDNSAENVGAVDNELEADVSSSTFYDNHASSTGAFVNYGAATISNSTFYDNQATNGSDHIVNVGEMILTNSTLVSDQPSHGGFDQVSNIDLLFVGSSIFSSNAANDLSTLNTIISLGYNVISHANHTPLSGNYSQDLIGAAASPLNLGTLADNGGDTMTFALGAGSVAIGAGNCKDMQLTSVDNVPPVLTDQRGTSRKPTCDAGAYES